MILQQFMPKVQLSMQQNKIYKIYQLLYDKYGPQGWWPYINHTPSYHPLDYSFPKNQDEIFEVCLGSILTQNTTFSSVVKSLNNLKELNCLSSQKIKNIDKETFKTAIKPVGYFNQKTRYILEFIKFYDSLNGSVPTRDELLNVTGIGEETADSILLYAYNQPQFKVDAYTKRLFLHLGFIDEKYKYKDIKNLVESKLKTIIKNQKDLIIVYQEFHALIVQHGKNFYSKKTYGAGCFLKDQL